MIRIPVKTTNPNNGSQGFSKGASMSNARRRKAQRQAVGLACRWILSSHGSPHPPWVVTVTRVAPSNGLDPHDGLGAALKGCIDGIADALGLKSDRDPRVTWVLAQRRGAKAEYCVEVVIEARA